MCNGAVSTEVVFTPVSNPVHMLLQEDSAGTDQQSILGQTLFNETNSPATLTYTVTPTSAEGCVGTPFTVTITVNPTGQVEPVSSQVVCNGDSTTVDFTTDNTAGTTTYQWSSDSDLGSGLSGSGNISFTAENLTTDLLVSTFTVIPTFTNGDVGCVGLPETFTITVTPTTNVTPFDDLFIFTGGSTETVTIESIIENTTFTWSTTVAVGIQGLVNTSGTTNIIPVETLTLAEGINTPLTVVYTIIPSISGDQVCLGIPYTYTVTVNPITGVTSIDDIVVCHNAPVGPIEFTSTVDAGTTTYQWEASGDDINLTQTDDGIGVINLFTAENLTSEPLVTTITVIPTLTNGNVSSIGDLLTFTITVNPVPQINNFSETICNESTFSTVSPTDTANGDVVPEGTTYSWITPVSNPVNAITGGSAGTDQQSILGQTLFNETNSPATLTYTVTPTSAEGCVGTFYNYCKSRAADK